MNLSPMNAIQTVGGENIRWHVINDYIAFVACILSCRPNENNTVRHRLTIGVYCVVPDKRTEATVASNIELSMKRRSGQWVVYAFN